MEIRKINISHEYGLDGDAALTCMLHDSGEEMRAYNSSLPAIIVVPGGGYCYVSAREGDPVAVNYFARHYQAFVLNYSVAPDYRWPLPLTQLAASVDYVRSHADELGIDPGRIFVEGFSAGGHLVGCLANMYDSLPVPEARGKRLSARPDAVALCYPVINYDSHHGSLESLAGEGNEKLYDALALEKRVTAAHPPTFIWTTAGDKAVDPRATTVYATALLTAGVMTECHVFPTGGHGGATCDECTVTGSRKSELAAAKIWLDLSDRFFKSL